MLTPQKVPNKIYEFLVEEYGGDLYKNKECENCYR